MAIEQFDTLLEAQALVTDWRTEYNTTDLSPRRACTRPDRVFADQWRRVQPSTALGVDRPTVSKNRRSPDMAERMITVDGVELCTEPFGNPADPPVLLVMGLGASMLWWDEGFCRSLADGGRYVIRYDHHDTGRSVTDEPGHPGYNGEDLALDAVRVLDGYGLPAAHLVGVSAGGALAQVVALARPDRVLSLVLISTSPTTPGDRGLPPPTDAFVQFVSTAEVDWSDSESVVGYLLDYSRVIAGEQRPFEEAPFHQLIWSDIERARDVAALQNHDVVAGDGPTLPGPSSITAPTLVVHGTADPMFPQEHGRTLAEEIPGAALLVLDGAGHGVYREDWGTIVPAILEHTATDRNGGAQWGCR